MYRFLLTPRWLALSLVVLVAVPFCVAMGLWQLDRFESRVDEHHVQQEESARQHTVALHRLTSGGRQVGADDLGRPVAVTGHYDTAHQLLVPNRTKHGTQGFYVLTPVRPADGGRAVPVVRGWAPGKASTRVAERLPKPPSGTVTVRGSLRLAENADDAEVRADQPLPAGQVGLVSSAALVNVLPYQVSDVWVAASHPPDGLRTVPLHKPQGSGLDARAFQNLGYTGEWFVFAGFAVFMWFRFVRREGEMRRDRAMGLRTEDDEEQAQPAAAAERAEPPVADRG